MRLLMKRVFAPNELWQGHSLAGLGRLTCGIQYLRHDQIHLQRRQVGGPDIAAYHRRQVGQRIGVVGRVIVSGAAGNALDRVTRSSEAEVIVTPWSSRIPNPV